MAGLIGSTITRSLYEDEENQQSAARPAPDVEEIARANLNLGIEYMRMGEYEKALSRLNRAKAAKPDYAPIHNTLGLLFQNMEQVEDAEKSFKHAIRLDGRNPFTLNNYGQFLCSQGRVTEAETYFLAAAENPLYHTPEIAYANVGTCAYLQGQTDKAAEYFQKALSINPRMPAVLIQMTEISSNSGAYLAAHDYLERYLEFSDHTPRSLWLGIRIESELGDINTVSSYALLLRNQYPESSEAQLLKEAGIR
jgi:type IV pilus assembly protein PilF